MKIEFKSESSIDGVFYFTEVNENRIVGSTKMDKDKAYEIFLRIVELKGEVRKLETIETIEL